MPTAGPRPLPRQIQGWTSTTAGNGDDTALAGSPCAAVASAVALHVTRHPGMRITLMAAARDELALAI